MARLFQDLFVSAAKTFPENKALLFEGRSMTYAELDRRSNEFSALVASKLPRSSRQPVIGLRMERGFDQIAGLLGILKAGAAYLPLDVSYPRERLELMVEKAGCGLVLADGDAPLGDAVLVNALKEEFPPFVGASSTNGDLAYVIFTSGSSGSPKGVEMGAKALLNLIDWQTNVSQGGTTLQYAPISFDVHFQEIFSTLLRGDSLVLVSEADRTNFEGLPALLDEYQVERLFLPCVALNALARSCQLSGSFPRHLREVAVAGEQLKITPSIREFFTRTGAELSNHYGPSETHVATWTRLSGAPDSWPSLPSIGRPLPNVEVLVLGPAGSPAVKGELLIGGVCLARGYAGDEALTSARFGPVDGKRFYRSGDLVETDANGDLVFLGRIDAQIKIRGHRVEPGEVEAVIEQIAPRVAACVHPHARDNGEVCLGAYLKGEFDPKFLRRALATKLPDYMVPAFIEKVEAFPLTPSGKIDRKKLVPGKRLRPELENDYLAPSGSVEIKLARIWEHVLELEGVGAQDNFFDLGGSSLLVLELLEAIRKDFPQKIGVGDIFDRPTVAKQAELLASSKIESPIREVQKNTPRAGGKDVAIVGMAVRFPGAESLEEFWNLMMKGESALKTFAPEETHPSVSSKTRQNPNFLRAKGEMPGARSFDEKFFGVAPLEARLMDPQHRKFLELCHEALESAGIDPSQATGKIGVYAGCGENTYQKNFLHHQDKTSQFGEFNLMLGNDKDYLATRAAHKLGLKGPAISLNTGCSTSLVAVIQAVEAIRSGLCESALAGGIAISGQQNKGYLHQEGSILSSDGQCRPYEQRASGTVFSDGGAVVVLKDFAKAKADGDHVFAVIKGVGLNNDGSEKMSFTAPTIQGQADAIGMALEDAGVSPEAIAFVEGHGTATPLGDPIEIQALSEAFKLAGAKKKQFCALGSVKSNIGHTTSAAGVAGLIKAAMALDRGVYPAIAGFNRENPQIQFSQSYFYPAKKSVRLAVPGAWAGVSSFGVGGTNAHALLQGVDAPKAASGENPEELFLLSAKSEWALKEMMKDLDQKLATQSHDRVSRSLFKRQERLWRSARSSSGKWLPPRAASANAPLAFLFPGQGAQQPRMGEQLSKRSEVFRKEYALCMEAASDYIGANLRAIINSERSNAAEVLKNTLYAQPAIFAYEYSMAKLLEDLGLTPAVCIGHSIGEFAAAAFNHVFASSEALKLVCARARLMEQLPEGAMTSVACSETVLKNYLPEEVDIAAVNGANSTVASGSHAGLEQLELRLRSEGIAYRRLAASRAFHSRQMDPILEEFERIAASTPLSAPKGRMISTVAGREECELFATPGYWSNHVSRPVLFWQALQAVSDEGLLFVEVGPGRVLSPLASRLANSRGEKTAALSLGASAQEELANFHRGLGELWTRGAHFSKERLFGNELPVAIATTTHPFAPNEHWLDWPIENEKGKANMKEQQTDTVERKIIAIFEEASGIDLRAYNRNTCFLEMGLDSLFLTQIALRLQSDLGVQIGFRELADQCSDLDALTKRVAREIGPETEEAPKERPSSALPEATAPASVSNEARDLMSAQIELMLKQLSLLGAAQEPHKKPDLPAKPQKAETFGAMARISTRARGEKLEPHLRDFIKEYNHKTKSSKLFAQAGRKLHADPRAVSGFRPETKELVYPIVVERSHGQKLIDLDGNEYVDMLCGFGSNFFGNGNQKILEALRQRLDEGMEIGPQHPLTLEVCELISELTGNERSAFCNTGSEAVLGAMRLARLVTGRKKIVVFENSYHGINDEVIVKGVKEGRALPAAPGIMPESAQNILVLEYGAEESLGQIEELAARGELAAVLVEPVQSRRCDFHPQEFLGKLREITASRDVCLIFDEVITGFRIRPGGAQAWFGIQADLCVYGKIVGGGMPIGIISGKKRYMDGLDGGGWSFGDGSVPEAGVTYFAGTFVRHPLALSAAKAALGILKEGGEKLYVDLNAKAKAWVESVNQLCERHNAGVSFANFGSLIKPKYSEREFKDAAVFFAALRFYGLHVYEGFPWFINLAHTDRELELAKEAIAKSLRLVVDKKFPDRSLLLLAEAPPEPGAKLGKDAKGNPAWFVPSSEKNGVYIQL